MKITTTFKVGAVSYTFDVEDDDPKEALHQAIALANPRTTCNVCGVTGLDAKTLTTNKTKEGYTYIKCECECGARSTLGEYRTGGYFWHEYEVWKPDGVENEQAAAPAQSNGKAAGDGSGRVSADALDKLNEKLAILSWSKDALGSWLKENYGVDQLRALTQQQARHAYRELDAIVKEEVPF